MEVFRKIKHFMNVNVLGRTWTWIRGRSSALDRDGNRMTPAILELSHVLRLRQKTGPGVGVSNMILWQITIS